MHTELLPISYFILKLTADPSILLLNMVKKEDFLTTDMNNLYAV